MSNRPLILHITGDYPDATRPPTTHAIKHLIDHLTDCDHVIISLTRTADPRRMLLRELPAPVGQRLFALHHFGLPLGVGLFVAFHRLAGQIENILDAHGLQPNFVHSHRMSFDGIAGWLISRRRNIPHLISVRGEVDRKVLRLKPTYRPLIATIMRQAHRIYFVSAWMRPELAHLTAPDPQRERLLPNVVANTNRAIVLVPAQSRLITAVNLDNHRRKIIQESIVARKGIDRLIKAFARVAATLPGVTLDIIGVGRSENADPIRRMVADVKLINRIRLRPPLPNRDYLAELPTALAFVLPSRNETFGMVYTEALFAGVPILYGRGTGIDGHLDGLDVGINVPPNDIPAIAAGLFSLATRNDEFRAAIARNGPELFRRFDAGTQVTMYMTDLEAGLRVRPQPSSKLSGHHRQNVA